MWRNLRDKIISYVYCRTAEISTKNSEKKTHINDVNREKREIARLHRHMHCQLLLFHPTPLNVFISVRASRLFNNFPQFSIVVVVAELQKKKVKAQGNFFIQLFLSRMSLLLPASCSLNRKKISSPDKVISLSHSHLCDCVSASIV